MQHIFISILLENYIFIVLFFSVFVGFGVGLQFKFCVKPVSCLIKFWISFSSALVGWLAIYTFVDLLFLSDSVVFNFAHLFLLAFGVFGIVGFLPRLSLNALDAVGKIIKSVIEK